MFLSVPGIPRAVARLYLRCYMLTDCYGQHKTQHGIVRTQSGSCRLF